MQRRLAFPLAALAVVTLSPVGCAARSGRGDEDATRLTSRVEAYWKRREAKDLHGAYAFYCSAYKKQVSEADFLRLTRLTRFDIRDTRVVAVTSESPARAQVTVSLRFTMATISVEPLESRTSEWWARDTDRQWCKENELLVLPFPRSPRPLSFR